MLAKRIIPCLDVDAGRTVKGIHFQELRDVGDPVSLGLAYQEQGADELVFLDISSYELRPIVRIVHPEDESALPSEKKLLEFVNLAHGYMHGKFSRSFPLLLFYIVEEFDNTPGSKRGIRTVPPRPAD